MFDLPVITAKVPLFMKRCWFFAWFFSGRKELKEKKRAAEAVEKEEKKAEADRLAQAKLTAEKEAVAQTRKRKKSLFSSETDDSIMENAKESAPKKKRSAQKETASSVPKTRKACIASPETDDSMLATPVATTLPGSKCARTSSSPTTRSSVNRLQPEETTSQSAVEKRRARSREETLETPATTPQKTEGGSPAKVRPRATWQQPPWSPKSESPRPVRKALRRKILTALSSSDSSPERSEGIFPSNQVNDLLLKKLSENRNEILTKKNGENWKATSLETYGGIFSKPFRFFLSEKEKAFGKKFFQIPSWKVSSDILVHNWNGFYSWCRAAFAKKRWGSAFSCWQREKKTFDLLPLGFN